LSFHLIVKKKKKENGRVKFVPKVLKAWRYCKNELFFSLIKSNVQKATSVKWQIVIFAMDLEGHEEPHLT